MDEPPSTQYRPRRLTAICGAALGAALFTPVPATADDIGKADAPTVDVASTVQSIQALDPDTLALSLISTGLIGLGLAMGGLVIVAHRRRQY
ncbi:hypothetical protein [Allorhizocola rhizosphaerae]|uniref:hypothetical protein n=1 Tax=Allorhizocola rhizosphaerae TaxID=1872709 RepID=UPI000E3EBB46|nr:hypothetical protein [Allorhizocola rhizosphaerae]